LDLVIFQTGLHVYAWASLTLNPFNASFVAGRTGTYHHAQILLYGMESCELSAQGSLQPWYSQSLPLKQLGL
jgi:hypothetical protein